MALPVPLFSRRHTHPPRFERFLDEVSLLAGAEALKVGQLRDRRHFVSGGRGRGCVRAWAGRGVRGKW